MRLRGRIAYKLLFILIVSAIVLIVFVSFFNEKVIQDEFLTQLPDLSSSSPEDLSIQLKDINTDQLINLTDFHYVIPNRMCSNYGKEPLAIIIVTSYAGHDELRSAHRQAISQTKLLEMGLLRIFLIAKLPPTERFITQSQIVSEQQKFGDLLQGNFIESYRNLSYKHIMGLRWAGVECAKSNYIVKIDDDTVYDVFQIKNYLESLEVNGRVANYFLAGYVLDNKLPIRITANKWYVSLEEYMANTYPDYLSGWLYITNPKTALRLVRESQRSQFFWIDDTWVTGVLRVRAQVPLLRLNHWFSANSQFIDCCVRDLKNFNYECEFYVAPNGGDSKLIIEFLHNVEKCYFDECLKRPAEKSLRNTCVGSVKDLLPEHGEAYMKPIKLR